MTLARASLADVTAVVPVRNGAPLLSSCLAALAAAGVTSVIVVDGLSDDGSREIARSSGATVLSDEGKGLPHARLLGASTATTPWVVLVDVDVLVPPDSMSRLLDEFVDGGYDGLQAGLVSVAGPGYWGQALAHHHLTGRSRWWFGLVATIFERERLVSNGFDDRFRSGEDIELRWRLQRAGMKLGVSREVLVEHRFGGDDFAFAKDQFLMDGFGLGLMVRKYGWRGLRLAALPAAAGARGAGLSMVRGDVRWLRYFLAFVWFNYAGLRRGLRS
jgi:glycosyltransferase involved in cell wall biosynthesis